MPSVDVGTGTICKFGTFDGINITSLTADVSRSKPDATKLNSTEPSGSTQAGGYRFLSGKLDYVTLNMECEFDPDKFSPTINGKDDLDIEFPNGEQWQFSKVACEQYTVSISPDGKSSATAVFKGDGVVVTTTDTDPTPTAGINDVGVGTTVALGTYGGEVASMTIEFRRAVLDATHLGTTVPTGDDFGGPSVVVGKLDDITVNMEAHFEAEEDVPTVEAVQDLVITFPTPAGKSTGAIWTWDENGSPAGHVQCESANVAVSPEEKMIANLVWKCHGICVLTPSAV